MLISIRRIAATIVSLSRFPPDRSQSRRVLPLLPRSPLTTDQNPKPVLETFKDHGFTDAQIDAIARKAPWIRSCRSGDLVGAKMSYLCRELGLDQLDVVKMATCDPGFLRSSLKNTIIPSIDQLVALLGSRCGVIPAIVRAPWLIRHTHSRVAANAAMLKDSGVPDPTVTKMMLTRQSGLVYQSPERFRSTLDSVMSAGFDPSTRTFVLAISAKTTMSSSMWEKKVGVYLSFGWSAREIESAFRKLPVLFMFSEEHLRRKLHFSMNVLGMRPAEVLLRVSVMTSSLEGTLIPRCCVLNVLIGKGLVKKDLNVPKALCKKKQIFASKFVEKYQSIAPEVLEAYQGKMRFAGFDHKSRSCGHLSGRSSSSFPGNPGRAPPTEGKVYCSL